MGRLQRELKKKRAHRPLRRLFQEIPNLLPRLAPCMLMSPLSVAQYLDPGFPPFDLVVFDEASQIPVWDAVGAIARGRQAIVVGDTRQLPPTSFFQRSAEEELPDDNDFEELESILDECVAACLPSRNLAWHYRSRHESLITFSNYHYYDNSLVTFPAAVTETRRLGVRLCPVPDGVYDRSRTRTNQAEAEALVREVTRRLLDPEGRRHSIGIVTFSLAQQVLVEELLDQARRAHPELELCFGDEIPEPVFVKNLENVQGDERDVILFSICYGPDEQGKVAMNFGPLNRQGGERRLNVAVTRAREQLLVFATLRADQIDLSRTAALGAAHLKSFLEYAADGPRVIGQALEREGPDQSGDLEEAIHDTLVAAGHQVERSVGCSGYRIDLAVVDPERPQRYLLGIECDGPGYQRAATARDRDRLREAVLGNLGWELHRIWCGDWWLAPDRERERLATALVAAQARAREQPPEPPEPPDPPEPEPEPEREPEPEPEPEEHERYPEAPPPEVTGAPEAFYEATSNGVLLQLLEEILAREAPIFLTLAARRLAATHGITRLTRKVRDRVVELAQLGQHRLEPADETGVLWAAGQDPATYGGYRVPAPDAAEERAIQEIPVAELANGAHLVLSRNVALSRTALARATAQLFGTARLGTKVRACLDQAIDQLAAQGRCVLDGETVRLP
jgi:hypothetical protein